MTTPLFESAPERRDTVCLLIALYAGAVALQLHNIPGVPAVVSGAFALGGLWFALMAVLVRVVAPDAAAASA